MKKYRIAALLAAGVLLFSGCGGEAPDDTAPVTQSAEPGPDYDPAKTVALESGRYTVTNDMLGYFFYKDYYDAVTAYYDSYYSAYGLDPTKDLKDQKYGDTVWFDHFMAVTVSNVKNYLYFAEAAADEGTVLDEADRAKIEDEITDVKAAAEEFGLSFQDFLSDRFGDGFTENALRKCLELYYLSDKQYNVLSSSVTFTDGDLEDYCKENLKDFLFVDYRMVEIRADQTEYADDAARAAGFAEGRSKAEYIAAAKDLEEYVERGVDYLKSINGTLDSPLTDDEIFTKVTNIVVQYAYNDKSAFGKWAFEDGRESGDIVMLDNGAGIYTVYYLESAPYRLENATKNYSYLAFGDEESANAALNELTSGERSAEALAALAEKYTDAVFSSEKEADLGETPPAVEAWLFDSSRKPGDCGVVEYNGSYIVLFFEGDGGVSWKLTAGKALHSKAVNDRFAEYQKKYEVKTNLENVYLISGENAFTREAENT